MISGLPRVKQAGRKVKKYVNGKLADAAQTP